MEPTEGKQGSFLEEISIDEVRALTRFGFCCEEKADLANNPWFELVSQDQQLGMRFYFNETRNLYKAEIGIYDNQIFYQENGDELESNLIIEINIDKSSVVFQVYLFPGTYVSGYITNDKVSISTANIIKKNNQINLGLSRAYFFNSQTEWILNINIHLPGILKIYKDVLKQFIITGKFILGTTEYEIKRVK